MAMDPSIAEVHSKCVNFFAALLDAIKAPGNSPSVSLLETEVQNELDKYKVWAGNVGAAFSGQYYKRSLDYRLREASFYKTQVLKLLESLRGTIQKAVSICNGGRVSSDELSESGSDTLADGHDLDDSPWEASSGSEEENMQVTAIKPSAPVIPQYRVAETKRSMTPVSSSEPSTELRQLVEPISFTVKCLWRIPIRRPAPIDRIKNKDAANASCYQPFDILYVKDKFPHLDERVANRLGKLISKRRQLLRYRKSHTDALKTIAAEPILTSELHVVEFGVPGDVAGGLVAPTNSAPSRHTQETKATTLRPHSTDIESQEQPHLYSPSVPESRTTIASDQATSNERLVIPPRPVGGNGKTLEQFLCPHCSVTQVIKSERLWKKHVLADLQPYVCTYSECELQEYFFDGREEWFNHETQHHRLEWYCNAQNHSSFTELSDFLVHMEKIHDNAMDDRQIQASRGMFQRPARSHSGVCTLCFKQASKLKTHMSRHLEQVALFAIPPANMMDDSGSDVDGSGLSHRNVNGSVLQKTMFQGSGHLRLSEDASDSDGASIAGEKLKEHATEEPSLEEISIPDLDIDENVLDSFWDMVTPKFREARAAMYGHQPSEAAQRRKENSPERSDNALIPGPLEVSYKPKSGKPGDIFTIELETLPDSEVISTLNNREKYTINCTVTFNSTPVHIHGLKPRFMQSGNHLALNTHLSYTIEAKIPPPAFHHGLEITRNVEVRLFVEYERYKKVETVEVGDFEYITEIGDTSNAVDDEETLGKSDPDVMLLNSSYQQHPVCGASISAYRFEQYYSPATFGGIVLVDGMPYGMTVHRMLEDSSYRENNEDIEPFKPKEQHSPEPKKIPMSAIFGGTTQFGDGSEYIGSEYSFTPDEFWQDGKISMAENKSIMAPNIDEEPMGDNGTSIYSDKRPGLSGSTESGEKTDKSGNEEGIDADDWTFFSIIQPAVDDIEKANTDNQLVSHLFGYIYASSGIRRWRHRELVHEIDWALISIREDRLLPHNVVRGGGQFCKLIPNFEPKHEYPFEVVKSDQIADLRVHWYGGTSGLRTGIISTSPDNVILEKRQESATLWSISGAVMKGDEGAWVLDSRSRVCGYIIATNRAKGVAYICPMEVALEDIKRKLDVTSVCLPGSEAAQKYLQSLDQANYGSTIKKFKERIQFGHKDVLYLETVAAKKNGFPCPHPDCHKVKFDRNYDLRHHMLLDHINVSRCIICSQGFENPHDRDQHQRNCGKAVVRASRG